MALIKLQGSDKSHDAVWIDPSTVQAIRENNGRNNCDVLVDGWWVTVIGVSAEDALAMLELEWYEYGKET